MSEHLSRRNLTRRTFLTAAGGVGAAAVVSQGGSVLHARTTAAVAAGVAPTQAVHLAATDGWVGIANPAGTVPTELSTFWPDPLAPSPFNLYVFGFRNVTGFTAAQIQATRGHAQISAPIMAFDEGREVRITLTNLGLSQRPDLVDGHTVHWHGFVDAIPLFDGVPELSISVPIGRDFTYEYVPKDAGTYMYHCHYEDVEHVQMGMTGMVYVRPKQNGSNPGGNVPAGRQLRYAYNDGDGSTQYDREYSFMLTEIWAEAHFRDAHIQTTDWTNFAPSFWAMNGRTYPDTIAPAGNPLVTPPIADPLARLQYQPNSSRINCVQGERVLLRISSLGYQNHVLTSDDISFTTVAKDASLLRGRDNSNNYYVGNQVEVGPGESRDVIFTAPAVGHTEQVFTFYDRNYAYLDNAGMTGAGGMMTEIHVYPDKPALAAAPNADNLIAGGGA